MAVVTTSLYANFSAGSSACPTVILSRILQVSSCQNLSKTNRQQMTSDGQSTAVSMYTKYIYQIYFQYIYINSCVWFLVAPGMPTGHFLCKLQLWVTYSYFLYFLIRELKSI